MSCQEDFGPLARMCTTEELWRSPNADSSDDAAWVHPAGNHSGSLRDFTGGIGVNEGSCGGWAGVSEPGTAVAPFGQGQGQFSALPCGVIARPVTCCAPLQ